MESGASSLFFLYSYYPCNMIRVFLESIISREDPTVHKILMKVSFGYVVVDVLKTVKFEENVPSDQK